MSFPFVTLAMPCSDHAVLLKATARPSRDGRAAALRRMARLEHGMASENQTRPHCVNQMGKTHSKPLAERCGRGTAWAQYAMCESAFMIKWKINIPLQSGLNR